MFQDINKTVRQITLEFKNAIIALNYCSLLFLTIEINSMKNAPIMLLTSSVQFVAKNNAPF